jgi:hypothetical protein
VATRRTRPSTAGAAGTPPGRVQAGARPRACPARTRAPGRRGRAGSDRARRPRGPGRSARPRPPPTPAAAVRCRARTPPALAHTVSVWSRGTLRPMRSG